ILETTTYAFVMAVNVPPRDPERPQDDPWDANTVRWLLSFRDVSKNWTRGTLTEHLRGQPRLDPSRVEAARAIARMHGVTCARHRDGGAVHFYRTDTEAPTYPSLQHERRELLRDSSDTPVATSETRSSI